MVIEISLLVRERLLNVVSVASKFHKGDPHQAHGQEQRKIIFVQCGRIQDEELGQEESALSESRRGWRRLNEVPGARRPKAVDECEAHRGEAQQRVGMTRRRALY